MFFYIYLDLFYFLSASFSVGMFFSSFSRIIIVSMLFLFVDVLGFEQVDDVHLIFSLASSKLSETK